MAQVSLTDGFEEFDGIVRAGSISAAARELGIPRPSLSRRLARLELRLGTRLVRRHSRRLVLTEAGQELHRRVERVLEEARAAHDAVVRLDGVPRGRLRVTTPPGRFINAAILSFVERWPEVTVQITTSAQHLDLVKDGYDIAIREGAVADDRLTGRCLWAGELIAVASPSYLHQHGTPQVPSDLLEHDCTVGFAGGSRPAQSWPLFAGGEVPVNGRLQAEDIEIHISAALSGFGISLVPRPLVAQAFAQEELAEVLPGVVGRKSEITLIYVEREFQPPQVRAFVEHAIAWIDANLDGV